MSLLGDSASCAAGSNPLNQVDKMFSKDQSMQREFGQAQNQMGSLRGAERRQMTQADRQLMQSMQGGGQMADPFKFDEFRQDVPNYGMQQPGRNWGAEFGRQSSAGPSAPQMQHAPPAVAQAGPSQWASEFQQGPMQHQGPVQARQEPMSSFGGYRGPRMGGYTPSFAMASMSNGPLQQMGAAQQQSAETNWEQEFERAAQQAPKEGEAETVTKEETKAETQDATEDATATASQSETALGQDDLERELGMEDFDNAAWLDSSFPPNWNEMWDKINSADDGSARVRAEDFRGTTGSYEFAKDNEYHKEDDPFALGSYMMDNGAKLSSAVLCFEEAVRRDPSHVEAWARLGDAQAQNEIEGQAIVALERAVSLNPRHERALLNLAISYTNEGYDLAASQILEKWITAKYPDIVELTAHSDSGDQSQGSSELERLRGRVTQMFLRAAQRTSPDGQIDPEVQVGLGVLFYRDEDYNKAVDCFRAALNARPNDASLWNRLGATLANSSQPEQAIDAYTHALSLRPSFVRARYNLAVSFINIGCYKEAADHILSAMALHETEDNRAIDFERSANLLDTLRRVFFAMDRRDLLAKLQPGASLNDFKGEFQF